MQSKFVAALLAGAFVTTSAFAQAAPAVDAVATSAPATAAAVASEPSPEAREAKLAANSPVLLTMNGAITSASHRLGEQFSLTVAQDVSVDGAVVIPRGTRAVGQITRRTGKGSFGKSGKMEFTFRYIDLDGRQIPIEGSHRQEGEGKTAATIGAVAAAGVIGGLIVKGKSAKVEAGREFTVHTVDAIPVVLPAGGGSAMIAQSYAPSAVTMQVMNDKQRKAAEKAERKRQRG